MGSASQNRLATLLICETNADQNFWRITTSPLSFLDRLFPLGVGRLSEDLALVNAVERGAQFRPGAGANHVAADLLQERELLRAGVERDEVHLHGPLAFLKDLA